MSYVPKSAWSVPNFSFLACLEVVWKFLVVGWGGVVGWLRPSLGFSFSQAEQNKWNCSRSTEKIFSKGEQQCSWEVGRGDFRKIFQIILDMIVSSSVIEIGWISIFLGLKMEFPPWHKNQFSSEHIWKNNQAFVQSDSIRFSTGIQGY